MKVTVGEPAPEFTLTDQDGSEWSLAANRGRPVVLYFYPKADTPGCTTQACEVRDAWEGFAERDAEVVGISPDPQEDVAKFAGKFGLPQRMLADPDRTAIDAYGVWGEKKMYGKSYEGVIRSSVVIDAEGTLAAVFDTIQPKEQAPKALTALDELAG